MKSLAVELAGEGVRVNCACPGGVDTALREQAAASLHDGANTRLFARTQENMPGLIPPTDVARAIAYLASGDAASITGASLVVDRGVLF